MTIYLARTLLLLASLCCTGLALGQKLDITLEGPWILYEDDHTFGDAHSPTHVIIAMSPGGTVHAPPTFSEGGDGTQIQPGISCVAFDNKCLLPSSKSLDYDSYPPPAHLKVHLKQGRNWYDNSKTTGAVYLILPMSDSYSNDGAEYMRFGTSFGSYGTPERHSIGTQFHYNTGPSTVNLGHCDPNGTPAIVCTNPASKGYDNTGTLRITMKAPEGMEYCSYHVRDAYPHMLLLLDDTSLLGGHNRNQDWAYIDLPDESDVYGSCLYCDPQGPLPFPCLGTGVGVGMVQLPKMNVADALKQIITQLQSVEPSSKDHKDSLNVTILWRELKSLDPRFPKFSQLRRIARELGESIDGLKRLSMSHVEAGQAGSKSDAPSDPAAQQAELTTGNLRSYIYQVLNSATSGKDCRSVQMLIIQ